MKKEIERIEKKIDEKSLPSFFQEQSLTANQKMIKILQKHLISVNTQKQLWQDLVQTFNLQEKGVSPTMPEKMKNEDLNLDWVNSFSFKKIKKNKVFFLL
jgi:hypothetical protein